MIGSLFTRAFTNWQSSRTRDASIDVTIIQDMRSVEILLENVKKCTTTEEARLSCAEHVGTNVRI